MRFWACVFAVFLLSLPLVLEAQDAASYFRQNCYSCHTIGGGRVTGPDLKDVVQRKDPAWLTDFMLNPKAKIDSGDPYAQQLFADAKGVIMPIVVGMNKTRAAALLDLIEAESKLEKSQFPGMQISDKPFTQADIDLGRQLFLGLKPLAGSGPSCISCHGVMGVARLGGGRLGPDLTRVYERLQGRRGLSTWLMAPATATMQATFKNNPLQDTEILPLVAFFEEAAKKGGQDNTVAILNFFLFGLGGTALALAIFELIWKRRFRAVRRPLVEGVKVETEL